MTVVLVPEAMKPCMAEKVVDAAMEAGRIAGVTVLFRSETMATLDLEIPSGYVLAGPGDLDEGAAGRTVPDVVGGAVRRAWVMYQHTAACGDDINWSKVLLHEFGHVYGLDDTSDDPTALMHYSAPSGSVVRDWEIQHMRRRLESY